jgi:hypothetical protein
MSGNSNTEAKFMRWSAIIISAGLLLIFMQLAAQIAFDFKWAGEKGGGPGSSYIGLVVLLIGAALMALISLSSRARAHRESASDPS